MMFWEILATVFCGFLLAGLVMPIRLFYKGTPKWLVPVAAGIGMIGFQVYSEYSWANNTITKLPDDSVVVATVPKKTWFRPWSYVKPQVFQFVVLDKSSIQISADNPALKKATLYFFERRAAAHPLGISIDCNKPALGFDDQTNQAITKILCGQ